MGMGKAAEGATGTIDANGAKNSKNEMAGAVAVADTLPSMGSHTS
jgi:hypothetical protein